MSVSIEVQHNILALDRVGDERMAGVGLSPATTAGITRYWAAWDADGAKTPVPLERLMIDQGWEIATRLSAAPLAARAVILADGIRVVHLNPYMPDDERQATCAWSLAAKLDDATGLLPIKRHNHHNQFWQVRTQQRLMIASRLLVPDALLWECDSIPMLVWRSGVSPWLLAGRLVGEDVPRGVKALYLKEDPLNWHTIRRSPIGDTFND